LAEKNCATFVCSTLRFEPSFDPSSRTSSWSWAKAALVMGSGPSSTTGSMSTTGFTKPNQANAIPVGGGCQIPRAGGFA
jgi:hypothetical protein